MIGWFLRWFSESGQYVTPDDIGIHHPKFGDTVVPRGFRFDGATGVANLSMAACATHDWLYLTGRINGRAVTRKWVDANYSADLKAAGHPKIAWIRAAFFKFWSRTWRRYRATDPQNTEARMFPNSESYMFPSWEIRDAYRRP